MVGCTIITPWGWPLTCCPSRRSALCAAVCLCLPLMVSACGSTGSTALFDLHGKRTLIVGHYGIRPVYRHLMLRWLYACDVPGPRARPGIRIDAFRGGDPTKSRTARSVLSEAYVVPASPGQAGVRGRTRVAVHRADFVVISIGAAMSRTTYYDLSTLCKFQVVGTGETR